jgi:hypothetical protein
MPSKLIFVTGVHRLFYIPRSFAETSLCRHDVIDPQPEIDYYKDFEAPQGYYTDTPNMISLLGIDLLAPE